MESLLKNYADLTFPAIEREFSNIKIDMICEYLEQRYNKNVILDDLCKLTGLSKFYLLRSFSKQKGLSPHRYLVTIRIKEAKKLNLIFKTLYLQVD